MRKLCIKCKASQQDKGPWRLRQGMICGLEVCGACGQRFGLVLTASERTRIMGGESVRSVVLGK